MAVNLCSLDMRAVRRHYLARKRVRRQLRHFFDAGNVHDFVQLAFGISNRAGNYSASEHGMGAVILSEASEQAIYDLATAISACPNVNHLPRVIYDRAIRGLKISIGSEIAMMLRPKKHWVGNVRTIWSHLLIKHRMSQRRANEELDLYYDGERESEMNYEVWAHVYLRMEPDIRTLGQQAAAVAEKQGVRPGRLLSCWPDAVASFLFEEFASRARRIQATDSVVRRVATFFLLRHVAHAFRLPGTDSRMALAPQSPAEVDGSLMEGRLVAAAQSSRWLPWL